VELRSLYGWLLREDEIRQKADLSLQNTEPASAGYMGGLADVVQLVLNDGFQAGSLALSYLAWRASRPHKPGPVTISCGNVTDSLDGGDADVEAAVAKIVAAADKNAH